MRLTRKEAIYGWKKEIFNFAGGYATNRIFMNNYYKQGYEMVGKKGDENLPSLIKECYEKEENVRVVNKKGEDIKDAFLEDIRIPYKEKNMEEINKVWIKLEIGYIGFD